MSWPWWHTANAASYDLWDLYQCSSPFPHSFEGENDPDPWVARFVHPSGPFFDAMVTPPRESAARPIPCPGSKASRALVKGGSNWRFFPHFESAKRVHEYHTNHMYTYIYTHTHTYHNFWWKTACPAMPSSKHRSHLKPNLDPPFLETGVNLEGLIPRQYSSFWVCRAIWIDLLLGCDELGILIGSV